MIEENISPEEAERIYGVLHQAYERIENEELAEDIESAARDIMESFN